MNPAEDREAGREQAERRLMDNLSMETLRAEMRDAVKDGMQSAMTPQAAEQFWAVGISMLQAQATNRAGTLVWSGVKSLLKTLAWAGLALVSIYALGGWPLVVTVWKAIFARTS